jgi:hypothetical protein
VIERINPGTQAIIAHGGAVKKVAIILVEKR